MVVPIATPSLRFPGEDGGRSLAEMAQRDLDATLQLLAERAQYITGASGAAIALSDGNEMICRASAGPSAPEIGAQLQTDSGLTGESVRTRQILRCDDAAIDTRVNRESCKALNIASVVVMPLIRDKQVAGVFELLSARTFAFEERDLAALQRLGDMIQTAIDQADAAKRTATDISLPASEPIAPLNQLSQPRPEQENEISTSAFHALTESESVATQPAKQEEAQPQPGPDSDTHSIVGSGGITKCKACGFPVSGGRNLCVDCETAGGTGIEPTAFLAQYNEPAAESWLRSNIYLVGTALMGALTLALVVWLR